MRGLAWYSGIVVLWSLVGLLIQVITEASDLATNLWAIALYVPVLVFFVGYLKRRQ